VRQERLRSSGVSAPFQDACVACGKPVPEAVHQEAATSNEAGN
jgi:hypothetical protein